MKIFISNSILQFKTRFIPDGCLILPMPNFISGGINITIAKLNLIKPTEIICETQDIMNILSPYFKEIPVYVMKYSNGIEYCGNPIKDKMNFIVISTYFVLILYGVILDNFLLAIFLLLINIIINLAVILWFSDKEKWEVGSKKIVHV